MSNVFKLLMIIRHTKYTHEKWLNVICGIVILRYTANIFSFFINIGVLGIIISTILSIVVAVICIVIFTLIKSVITHRIEKKNLYKLKEDAPAEMIDMIEMDKSRIESKRLGRNMAIASALMMIIAYIAFWMLMANVYDGDNGILIGAALILIVSPFIISSSIMGKKKWALDKNYKEFFEKSVINKVLESVFDVKEFNRWKGFEKNIVDDLKIFPQFDHYRGEDYLSARYKETDFVQSDVYLSRDEERRRTDKKGNTRIEIVSVTVFRGRLVIVDYDAISDEPVYVHDKRIKNTRTIIETESGSFNDRFAIEAGSSLSAMRILKPQVLEGILTASNKLNCSMSMVFKDDKIYMAINSGDSFVSENYGGSIFEHEERIKKDVQIIIDLIDSIYLK
ncbi:DUF3137 domain-containing protein [Sedimentibacter hydroxybenzoicus DSM 7310]|uniref:DUF3137 domain-containing protein n=1 Tax=Sedimentibacter hydroxybenzoicus DSM 7310 TaxID=1123245 RepID=A0A974BI83_SEDHY|nr:DUF3137 domain-containing protein [Sedimentibacter hydroxybenzoicus]NYB73653.1 DUF3137 domain-containing protein [Sedimentibacter hydroxybenzoicus DSM 7310]